MGAAVKAAALISGNFYPLFRHLTDENRKALRVEWVRNDKPAIPRSPGREIARAAQVREK